MGRHCHADQSVLKRRMNAAGALHTDERRYLEWPRMRLSGSFVDGKRHHSKPAVLDQTSVMAFIGSRHSVR